MPKGAVPNDAVLDEWRSYQFIQNEQQIFFCLFHQIEGTIVETPVNNHAHAG